MQIYSIRKISGKPITSNKVSQIASKENNLMYIAITNDLKGYTSLIEDLKKECFEIEIKESEIILYDKAYIIENFISFSIEYDGKEINYNNPHKIRYKVYRDGLFSKEIKYNNGQRDKIEKLGTIFDNNDNPLWQTARQIYNKHWSDE